MTAIQGDVVIGLLIGIWFTLNVILMFTILRRR